jgi:NADPH2:quinone reductase
VQALIAAPDAAGGIRLAAVPEPVPGPDQVLVEVRHVSVNFGEVRYLDGWPAGAVLGYDAAGYVVRAADNGTGPAAGERVVAFGAGAWGQRAVFGADSVATIPDQLDLSDAAALPMAGITALRTVRAAGSLLGRRVLVTGASGGVGRLAVQLARLGGAHVIASVGSPERGKGLEALGADEVVVGLDAVPAPVDVVLEHVGGAHLVKAWQLLGPGGHLQSIGWASGEPAVFPPGSIFTLGAAKTLQSFGDASNPGPDLAVLVDLAACGAVTPQVGWRGSWRHINVAIQALLGRQVLGKVVLDLD